MQASEATKKWKAAAASKDDAAARQAFSNLNESCIQALDLSFRELLDMGLPHTAAAWLERYEPEAASGKAVDAAGNTKLHVLADTAAPAALLAELVAMGCQPDAVNRDNDTALHIAAKAGQVEVCRALLQLGASPMRKNNKNRTPGGQLKLAPEVKALLAEAEEEAKSQAQSRAAELWDGKMKAAQTQSACGLRCV